MTLRRNCCVFSCCGCSNSCSGGADSQILPSAKNITRPDTSRANFISWVKRFHGGPPCPWDAVFIITKGKAEKQDEHFCLLFLCSCAILLNTDRNIRYCAIVAQLDRAFGSDPEGQRFESSRSHQEKPEHECVLRVSGQFDFSRMNGSPLVRHSYGLGTAG